mgnify:CR=1 FL=1|jgi:hypothetical protein
MPSRASYRVVCALLLTACVGGCGSMPSLTTGSLFGGGGDKKAADAAPPKPAAPADTAMNRGFQVGLVSARAVKCGFNFDPARVKGNWLAAEAKAGTPVDEIGKAEKVYNVGFSGVAKAVAGNANYCTARKTKEIKEDLGLLLAGNFSPQPFRPKEEEEEGLISFGGTSIKFE